MSIKVHKTAILFVVVIALAGSGWGLHKWLTNYYRPMRDARPILQMLERGTPGDLDAAARSLYDKPRLGEPGASRVRQAVLSKFASATNEESLFYVFRVILAGQDDQQFMFQGEDEWAIIKAAVERNNALPGVFTTFTIATDTNGVNWLSFRLPPIR
jgi:hypothetical protein